MRDYNDGITNGYAWYRVAGGRQDYMTYFRRGREVTIEISDVKLISASLLPAHWYYLRKSLLNYIEDAYYGIRGSVTDIFGNPLKALVKVESHDFDNSEIYSDSLTGAYYRMISPGTYSLTFSSPGFITKTINNVTASSFSSTVLNVELSPQSPYQLALTSLIEGFYNGTVMISDTVTVELHNASAPFGIVEQKKMILNSSGYGTTSFTSALETASYYVVVKHRNSVETWSAAPQAFFSGLMYYDFTTAQNKAYGNNLVQNGTKWCIYSGEVTNNYFIEFDDLIQVYNFYLLGLADPGYYVEDVTGNGFVEFDDLLLVYNNYLGEVYSHNPLNPVLSTNLLRLSK
jgi:hypothetical protein